MSVRVVRIEHLPGAVGEELAKLAARNAELVGAAVADMPRRFLNAARDFYPTVLNVITGRLKKSFTPFSRRAGPDSWELGLKSEVDYAAAQHWGFKGEVGVPAHARRGGTYGFHAVRAHTRGMNIKPKYFFSRPMETVADEVLDELKKMIGFEP